MASVGQAREELESQSSSWSNINGTTTLGSGLVVDYGVTENEVSVNNGDRF